MMNVIEKVIFVVTVDALESSNSQYPGNEDQPMLTDSSKGGRKREQHHLERPVFLRRWALYDSRLDFKKG